MMKRFLLGAAIMLSAGAGTSSAHPWYVPPDHYYRRLAHEWVQFYLRRPALPRDVALITNQLRSGMSPDAVQANILASPEYFQKTGYNLNIWANWMVSDTLGRPITPQERSLVTSIAVTQGRYRAAMVTLQSRHAPPWLWGW